MAAPSPDAVAVLSALDDPVRRRLYDYVCAQGAPVARDEAAAGVGIARSLAAYHLDKLAAENLLTVTYARPAGRGGPGAGRPAKRYARSDVEVVASVPPRDYGLAAILLAEAAAGDESGATERSLRAAARRVGAEIAEDEGGRAQDVRRVLGERGYEPYDDEPGPVVRLRNCPFHAAAQREPAVVCAMNLALLDGLLEGLDGHELEAALEPAPGRCCVAIRPATRRKEPDP